MKKYMLLAVIMTAMVGGSAWATDPVTHTEYGGASGTNATNDVKLTIEKYCSVAVDDLYLNVGFTTAGVGTASGDATCTVRSNFATTATASIAKSTAYDGLLTHPGADWGWTVTFDSDNVESIVAGTPNETPVHVALAGITLADAPILSAANVAVLTVTIAAAS